MARVREQSHGQCYLCKGTFPKGSMSRHLTKCLAAHEPALEGDQGKATKGKWFRIVVEGDKYRPQYWLHLEMPGTATLTDLDQILRKLWVECCGHLSEFRIQGPKRPAMRSLADIMAANAMEWNEPDEMDMEEPVSYIFRKGMKLSYDYDFGSTTTLNIKVVEEHTGPIAKSNDIRVLARNDPPHIPCGMCQKAAATIIDIERSYDRSGWLCDECAKKAGPENREMTLPVVNSPRTGVCAYSGA